MFKEKLNEIINHIQDNELKEKIKTLLPKQSFISKIIKKEINESQYNEILNKIIDIVLNDTLIKYPFTVYYDTNLNSSLILSIKNLLSLNNSIDFSENNTFKFYPITLSDEKLQELYFQELRKLIKVHLETNQNIETLIEEQIDKNKKEYEEEKTKLKKMEMLPYYGTPKFMLEKSKYILECASKLNIDTTTLNRLVSELEELYNKYPNNSNMSYMENYNHNNINDFKSNYIEIENTYLKILFIEQKLSELTENVWKNYLTNPNNHNNSSFKYLIHVFTEGLVPPDKMRKACASLVTENLLTIPYGDCGIIYNFDMHSVDTMSTEDAGSWITTKEEFIERDFPISWQLTTPNSNCVFYEHAKTSKLLLPTTIERTAINNNLKCNNNQPLTYDRCLYSEIFLNNKATVCGVFYTDDTKDISKISEYAKQYNLPLIHLSLKELRLLHQNNVLKNEDFIIEEEQTPKL